MDRKTEIEEAYGRKQLTDLTVLDLPTIIEYIAIILDELRDKNSEDFDLEAWKKRAHLSGGTIVNG